MYPDTFDYQDPDTVSEAVDLLAEHDPFSTEVLAGGHSLLPTMKTGFASPDVVVDIGGIDELHGIERTDDELRIGALTTYDTLTSSSAVAEDASVVAQAAGEIGDVQVRNRGTIGGNIAHADPASDLPGAILVHDADIVTAGPNGTRVLDADEFFLGMYATTLGEEEIVTEIRIPRRRAETVGAYVKKPSPSSGYAMIGIAVSLALNDGRVQDVRVAANGAMDHAVRLTGAESQIEGNRLDEQTIDAAAEHATDDLDVDRFLDDMQASGEFRANLVEVYTQRALESLL